MGFVKCCEIIVLALVSVFCFVAPSNAAMQTDPRSLPSENIVLFAPDNPVLNLQLDELAGPRDEGFAATTVTIVDQAGNARTMRPNAKGIAVVKDLKAGLYTVIAFNQWAHAATIFAARPTNKQPDSNSPIFDDALGKDNTDQSPAAKLRVTMMRTVPEKLLPLATKTLVDDPTARVADIDPTVVQKLPGRQPVDYQVRLGRGGILRGQLLSVIRPQSKYSAVKGTRITVMKNGIPVGTTTANALGEFKIAGLRSGIHGLLVSGRGGYAAMSFQALHGTTIAGNNVFQLAGSRSTQVSPTATQNRAQYGGTILPVAIVPPTHVPAVLSAINNFYPKADKFRGAEYQTPGDRPSLIELGNSDVSLSDIGQNYSGHFANDAQHYNPLRKGSAGSTSSHSVGSSLGSSGLGGLVGTAGAMVLPVLAADDDAPGIVTTNAGL